MDRFNSKEETLDTTLQIAKDIIYSDGTMDQKVNLINSELIKVRKNVISDLKQAMAGIAIIDRQFIEEWIEDYLQ